MIENIKKERKMEHELKEKCTGIMDRIVKLRDSL
ncbi:hypothetical protein PM8797T_31925 [Gimesia maris DSM 8797]|nr:hypothetical protein PM8797T_31925 [Gimesia maris DSM 8797]